MALAPTPMMFCESALCRISQDVSAETACEILHKALSQNIMGVGASAIFTSSHDCGDEVAHQGLGCSAIIYPRHRCATKKLPEVPFLAQLIIFRRQDQ